jgi:hypothetical protein
MEQFLIPGSPASCLLPSDQPANPSRGSIKGFVNPSCSETEREIPRPVNSARGGSFTVKLWAFPHHGPEIFLVYLLLEHTNVSSKSTGYAAIIVCCVLLVLNWRVLLIWSVPADFYFILGYQTDPDDLYFKT